MSTLLEIAAAIEASNNSFEEFKARMDGRLDGIEKDQAEKNRPNFASGYSRESRIETANDPAVKAFSAYLRSGDKTELKSMQIGTGPDGGFAVPKVIDGMIESVAFKESPMRQVSQVIQISTPDYHKLVNTRGWQASWVGETQVRAATNTAQLVDICPPMGELYANPQASAQMLDDVFFDAGQWIASEIGLAFGQAESDTFLNGTGVNQPKGFLTAPTAATGDATRAFGTLQYVPTGAANDWAALTSTVNPADALIKLVFTLKVGYRRGACWMLHPSLLGDIVGFKDYQGRYVLQPAILEGAPMTMWGYPVYENEFMPAKSANSFSVAFGNFQRGYLIVDRIGTSVLVDPFSNKPNVGYYCRKRTGGSLLNSEAIKLLKFAAS